MLVNVVRQLLATRQVTVFASKCPLFDAEPLPVKWPFTEAGVPSIPRDFMPSAWSSIVAHTVLVYYTAPESLPGTNGGEIRGIVAISATFGVNSSRQVSVSAASILEINKDGILSDKKNLHTV